MFKNKNHVDIYKASIHIRDLYNDLDEPTETELTRNFLKKISSSHRVKHFLLNQKTEKRLGADWYWCIITDVGIYEFVIQAKKIHKKPTISVLRYNKGKQMDALIDWGQEIDAVPLYVFYSNEIKNNQCKWNNKKTPEGVFFAPAKCLYEYACDNKAIPTLLPISCMFTCLSKHCHYSSNPKDRFCVMCNKCKNKKCKKNHYTTSLTPFENVFSKIYNIDCNPASTNEKYLLLISAESVLRKNNKFLTFCFNNTASKKAKILNNIIITDYTNKHRGDYITSLLGPEYSKDENNILDKSFIKEVLSKKKEKFQVFKNVGIFGSYAKEGMATAKSDVDIMLEYDLDKIKSEEDLEKIINFIKEVAFELKKSVDFVDYTTVKKRNDNFYKQVKKTIEWL